MIKVTVPCTSANLGSGFDVLGLALSLKAEFEFELSESTWVEGCDVQYANEDNLVVQSFNAVYKKANQTAPKLHCIIHSPIPLARGLGSSSVCICAGVLAANYYLGNLYNLEECFQIASDLEGHPDNVAPCLYGGLMASTKKDDTWIAASLEISNHLKFYACIPDFELSTKKSREVLPAQIRHSDAVSNLSRLAFLIQGLKTANQEFLTLGFMDVLHQPYRFPLIQGSDAILAWCRENGCACYLSGAGPTLMLVSVSELNLLSLKEIIPSAWNLVPLFISKKGAQIDE